mmetsp:Transcript_20652/g.61600  ORF Transcript_20652/g.61600 Transcript_20652/m.61600 type:complete len:209 (+) Transcript_20652:92-718(+)
MYVSVRQAHRQACRQTGGQATRAIASTAAPAAAVASAWRAQGAGGHLHVVHIELAGVGQFARWCVDVHTGKGQPPESGSTLVDASASVQGRLGMCIDRPCLRPLLPSTSHSPPATAPSTSQGPALHTLTSAAYACMGKGRQKAYAHACARGRTPPLQLRHTQKHTGGGEGQVGPPALPLSGPSSLGSLELLPGRSRNKQNPDAPILPC